MWKGHWTCPLDRVLSEDVGGASRTPGPFLNLFVQNVGCSRPKNPPTVNSTKQLLSPLALLSLCTKPRQNFSLANLVFGGGFFIFIFNFISWKSWAVLVRRWSVITRVDVKKISAGLFWGFFFLVTTYLLCTQAAVWNPPMLMWIVTYICPPRVGNQVRYVLTGATFFFFYARHPSSVGHAVPPAQPLPRPVGEAPTPRRLLLLLAQSLKSGNNRLSRWDVRLFSGGSSRFLRCEIHRDGFTGRFGNSRWFTELPLMSERAVKWGIFPFFKFFFLK